MFEPYDVIGKVGDWDLHWADFDIIAFDAGTKNGISRDFALNISGRFMLLTDMARSFYPDRPVANNEEYLIPVSNLSMNVPESYHYAAIILPALHGRNISTIFLLNEYFDTRYANTTLDRAEGFAKTAEAAIDLNRFSDKIAAFRNLPSPAAILYTVPSYADRDYPEYMITAYEGLYFGNFPCRFINDRQILGNALAKYKLLVIPNAKFVTNEIFDKIIEFTQNGGKVMIYGKDALKYDPYGKMIADRETKMNKNFIRLNNGTNREYFAEYINFLKKEKISPPVQVTDLNGQIPFGIECRSTVTKDGKQLLYIVNINHTPVDIKINSSRKWYNVLKDKKAPSQITLKPLDIHLLQSI